MDNTTELGSAGIHINGRLRDLSQYIYGTTRLGDGKIPFNERVKTARAAMDAGIWFHTSDQYDDALRVLGTAFDEDRDSVPKLIFKIGWSTIDQVRETIRKNLEPVGLESMDMGQLCLNGDLAEQLVSGGACYEGFQEMKDEGLVKRFVLEVFPWTSQLPIDALRQSDPGRVLDGYMFYLNPLQRFASNELWDLLEERNEPIIAMRTVSGGDVHRLRDVPGAAWKDYLRERAVEVAPIFERSGIKTWPEFCVRFAHSYPQVRATVGSTSRVDRLNEFLAAAKHIEPLPDDIMAEFAALQRRWSDETDVHAEPWTM